MAKYYIENEFDIHPSVYIAPSARIYGKVKIGANCSIWDGVTIRGDLAPVEIGEGTSIQENAVVHVDDDLPTVIGNFVTVGHLAIVHGATVEDYCIIAIKSAVLSGAYIGSNCIVGAGAVVLENKIIPPNSLVFGVPGKVMKPLTPGQMEKIRRNAQSYIDLSRHYLKKVAK